MYLHYYKKCGSYLTKNTLCLHYKSNQLTSLRETIIVYCANRTEHINTLCEHSTLQEVYTVSTVFRVHYCLVWSTAGRRDLGQVLMKSYPLPTKFGKAEVWENILQKRSCTSSKLHGVTSQKTLHSILINSQSRNNHHHHHHHHPTFSVMSFLSKLLLSRPFLTASCI